MDFFNDFWNWAWARHSNELSWYIRPLFFIPFCFFAYRRSLAGMLWTLFALLTSMFWFPAPKQPRPEVLAFLKMEQDYVLTPWTFEKVLLTLTVPLTFTGLAFAFWYRRWQYGFIIMVAVAIGKIVWSSAFGGSAGSAVILPALVGLVSCVVALAWMVRHTTSKTPSKSHD